MMIRLFEVHMKRKFTQTEFDLYRINNSTPKKTKKKKQLSTEESSFILGIPKEAYENTEPKKSS